MRKTATEKYHYRECGLDYIYLAGGFHYVNRPGGRRHVVIKNVDELQEAIGRMLIEQKKNLSGREIRFLRHEMLMSQATLAKLLEVSEQAVHRWEKGKTGQVPKPAEALIRLLYREHIKAGNGSIRTRLEKLADLEDAMAGTKVTARKKNNTWQLELQAA
jgi:DNA-binding transcriptional regulator YiaG